MSDEIPPTEVPEQPEAGPDYWPNEWARKIERAEQQLADSPQPEIPQVEPLDIEQRIAEAEQATEPEPEAAGFDPGDHTVTEVEDYVNANPDERQAVLDAEVAGKNRVTLVDWLGGG